MSEMNTHHLPSPISKRTRKSTVTVKDNDVQQRERKRALDRKAQRASREKTRTHIANLERMVQVLSDRSGSAATHELLEEISTLHAEIDRLKKIIDGIKCLLGVDMPEVGTSCRLTFFRRFSQSLDRDGTSSNGPDLNESVLCEVRSPSVDAPKVHNYEGQEAGSWIEDVKNTVENDAMNGDVIDVDEEVTHSIINPAPQSKPATNLDWMEFNDEDSTTLTGTLEDVSIPTSHEITRRGSTSSIIRMLPPAVPSYEPCVEWKKANKIYARIFEFERQRIAEADTADSGSLVKVVKDGWDSLSVTELNNPIFEILREVDRHLFWDLDPITKIANLYKSMLILKYYFNAAPKNLEKMPEWQRPVQSQKARRHPLPIDFFPWPALRDHLVRHHNYYFRTPNFSVSYRKHFKFNWPFGFDDTYTYDRDAKVYRLSPLFERYHRDVRSWSLKKVFFEKFPEFIGEMSVFDEEVPEISTTPRVPAYPLFPSCYSESTVQQTAVAREMNHRFAEDDIMQLFDECPPT